MRTTPELVDRLADGEVFVFGSNAAGLHAGGAARIAVERFGAVWGQGDGLQGRSYAIDTMSGFPVLRDAVDRFLSYAAERPEFTFLVTPIGCGIAGYDPGQVAPFFRDAPSNVVLPASFCDVLYPKVPRPSHELAYDPGDPKTFDVGDAEERIEAGL